MGRTDDLKTPSRGRAPTPAVLAVVLSLAGCAAFGGGPGSEAATPTSSDSEQQGAPAAGTAGTDDSVPAPASSIDERLLAGDYEGVLAIYAADTTLHADEDATYRAALAAAMSGHAAHDPARATRLLNRVLERNPDSERRFEIEVYLDVLAREQAGSATIRRLDRELQQLKAIDLGRAPEPAAGQP